MIRVVFFGNSDGVFSNRHFTALQATPCNIVAVVDTPPAKRTSTNTRLQSGAPGFVEEARVAGIPVFEPANPNQPEFIQTLRGLQADLFLAIGYTAILREAILAIPHIPPVNFHPSLLPAYRGKHPLFWALRNGERWVGLTVHVMDAGIDTGDILYQVRVRTRRLDSVSALYDRVIARSLALAPRLIADIASGSLRPRPQPGAGASYFSSIAPDDFRLDWRRPAVEICRWVNASPGQCFSHFTGQRLYLFDAEPHRAASSPPATLLAVGRSTMTVASSDGAVRLGGVRTEDGSAQSAAGWCRMHGLRPGDSLIPTIA